MSPLFFASSNPHKFTEVQQILAVLEIPVEFACIELTEIQADDLESIAAGKAQEASAHLGAAAFVEDAGLFIDDLKGFPGPYSAYAFRTLGIDGVLRLIQGCHGRRAQFRSVVGYSKPGAEPRCFSASVDGMIALAPHGIGWGYDPIFIPDGAGGRTFGELEEEKNDHSHRRKSLLMLAQDLL